MEPSLEDLLREEPDEVLFANMKHNSHCDFEKRIISGRILCERQKFDRLKMSGEKKMLIDSMKERIKTSNDPVETMRRLRRKALRPSLWSIFFTLLFVTTEVFDIRRTQKDFDWVGLSIFLLTVIIILVYEFATLSKHIQRKVIAEQDLKELLANRIARIEQEWPF